MEPFLKYEWRGPQTDIHYHFRFYGRILPEVMMHFSFNVGHSLYRVMLQASTVNCSSLIFAQKFRVSITNGAVVIHGKLQLAGKQICSNEMVAIQVPTTSSTKLYFRPMQHLLGHILTYDYICISCYVHHITNPPDTSGLSKYLPCCIKGSMLLKGKIQTVPYQLVDPSSQLYFTTSYIINGVVLQTCSLY